MFEEVTGTERESALRALATIWMLRIESPPSSKKLSNTPTPSTPSTSHQIRASVRSTSTVGAQYPTPRSGRALSGAGRRARSTFPLGVRGSWSSSTYCDGTNWAGRRLSRNERIRGTIVRRNTPRSGLFV